VRDNNQNTEVWRFWKNEFLLKKKKSFDTILFFIYNFFYIWVKVNLLSKVKPKSLKLVTTLTLISTGLLFTVLVPTVISLGS